VEPIRVLVCDDVEAFRALLRYTLQEDPGIEVVGEAADGMAAIEEAERLQPDVVLLDLTMPILDGMDAIPAVLERAPSAQVVALSGWGADRVEQAALDQGAIAYVEKSDDVEAIRAAVRAAARQGRLPLEP
jgi:DNA-binding NarL/FixJ family response regulator